MIGPTTRDLAEAAGVSLATVDRVLNNRPNVSARARASVNEAIEKIGFARNLAAVNLTRNRPYRFRFILPEQGDQYLQQLLQQIEHANQSFRREMTVVETVQIPMSDPHRIANYLAMQNASDLDGVAVMAPETPPVRDAMARMTERGMHVVQLLTGREQPEQFDFVGVDNFAAGATAGRIMGRFVSPRAGKIVVLADTMQAVDSIERRFGFDAVINQDFVDLTPLPTLETHGDTRRTAEIVGNQFSSHTDIVGIYIMSAEARVPLEAAARIAFLSRMVTVVHERTPFTETALNKDIIDAIIAQNPGHAIRSALRFLRARCEDREPNSEQERLRIEVLLKDNL